jgi:hypothetical protein
MEVNYIQKDSNITTTDQGRARRGRESVIKIKRVV